MAYFDDHPQFFRLLLGILLVYLSMLGAINFYRYASTPTDENWFSTTPTNVYIIKSFPAPSLNEYANDRNNFADSIQVGDILLNVNDKKFSRNQSLPDMQQALPNEAALRLRILRPSSNQEKNYHVTKSALPDSFYRLLPPTARVTDVFKNGASDRAGMQIGDLICRINGHDLKNYEEAAGEADRILRSGEG